MKNKKHSLQLVLSLTTVFDQQTISPSTSFQGSPFSHVTEYIKEEGEFKHQKAQKNFPNSFRTL